MTGRIKDEDKGHPFLVVRPIEPTSEQHFAPDPEVNKRAMALLAEARRAFRAKTIPIPGSDNRLSPDLFVNWSFGAAVLSEAEQVPERNVVVEADTESYSLHAANSSLKLMFTSDLLGKYWYRFREKTIFDAIDLAHHLETAKNRGESIRDVLDAANKPNPPSSPRRRK